MAAIDRSFLYAAPEEQASPPTSRERNRLGLVRGFPMLILILIGFGLLAGYQSSQAGGTSQKVATAEVPTNIVTLDAEWKGGGEVDAVDAVSCLANLLIDAGRGTLNATRKEVLGKVGTLLLKTGKACAMIMLSAGEGISLATGKTPPPQELAVAGGCGALAIAGGVMAHQFANTTDNLKNLGIEDGIKKLGDSMNKDKSELEHVMNHDTSNIINVIQEFRAQVHERWIFRTNDNLQMIKKHYVVCISGLREFCSQCDRLLDFNKLEVHTKPKAFERYVRSFKAIMKIQERKYFWTDIADIGKLFAQARSQVLALQVAACACPVPARLHQQPERECHSHQSQQFTKECNEDTEGFHSILQRECAYNIRATAANLSKLRMACFREGFQDQDVINKLNGSVADLPRELEKVRGHNLHGEVQDLPRNATEVSIVVGVLNGDLKDLPRNLKELRARSSGLSGSIADLPKGLRELNFSDTSHKIHGALKDLPLQLKILKLNCTHVDAGEIWHLPRSLTTASISIRRMYGRLSDLPKSMKWLDVSVHGGRAVTEENNSESSWWWPFGGREHGTDGLVILEGHIDDLPQSLQYFRCFRCGRIWGSLENLPASVEDFVVHVPKLCFVCHLDLRVWIPGQSGVNVYPTGGACSKCKPCAQRQLPRVDTDSYPLCPTPSPTPLGKRRAHP